MKYVLRKSGIEFHNFNDALELASSTMGETTIYCVVGEYRVKDGQLRVVSLDGEDEERQDQEGS